MTTETSSAAVAHTPKSQATAYASGSSLVSDVANSSLVRCLLLDSQVLRENRAVLRSILSLFSTAMHVAILCSSLAIPPQLWLSCPTVRMRPACLHPVLPLMSVPSIAHHVDCAVAG
ncbi:hypothetical protein HaLaN_07051 [Haematococcus lacustris]|uniref:Uncharacterized protein n=1 Tax=Haematococcus lacustris TaxID=44745 RepID=A0A699YV60_HAELA|nr:hypothetical protein HaLaN_07051 [Haematococcus lacustris]